MPVWWHQKHFACHDKGKEKILPNKQIESAEGWQKKTLQDSYAYEFVFEFVQRFCNGHCCETPFIIKKEIYKVFRLWQSYEYNGFATAVSMRNHLS